MLSLVYARALKDIFKIGVSGGGKSDFNIHIGPPACEYGYSRSRAEGNGDFNAVYFGKGVVYCAGYLRFEQVHFNNVRGYAGYVAAFGAADGHKV